MSKQIIKQSKILLINKILVIVPVSKNAKSKLHSIICIIENKIIASTQQFSNFEHKKLSNKLNIITINIKNKSVLFFLYKILNCYKL